MSWWDSFIAMWYRQVKRFWHAKARVIGTITQPIFWLIFFGVGFAASFKGAVFGGLDYLSFMFPGIILMTIFMSSFMSGISVIWDKEFGYLKVVLVAPSSRKASILGRSLGDATIAIIQGIIILIIGYPLVRSINLVNIIPLLAVALLVSMTFAGIGILIATRIQTMEGFQLIINIIAMPLIFLSGIFYPIDALPIWLKVIAYINPLTYGVDASRILLTGTGSLGLITDITLLIILSGLFMTLAMHQFEKATID